nr:hypothetical protein [Chroococcidiopsis sp. CCMEE 29]
MKVSLSQLKLVGLKPLTFLPLCLAVKRLAPTLAQALMIWFDTKLNLFLASLYMTAWIELRLVKVGLTEELMNSQHNANWVAVSFNLAYCSEVG